MYELKVTTRFAAAHRLTMVGPNTNLHGHNWKVEVYLAGSPGQPGCSWTLAGVSPFARDHRPPGPPVLEELPYFKMMACLSIIAAI
jgi:hypothetical protein